MVRPAVKEDLAAILALYRHLHPTDPVIDDATASATWSSLQTSGMVTVVVAEMAGQVVASCTLAIVPNLSRGARPYGVIENVVTHPDHRRSGLGHAVVGAAVERAREARCYKVVLATGSTRETTLRFYEGAGFQRDGKTYFEIRLP